MTIRTKENIEIDTDSEIYRQYLRVAAIEARCFDVAESAPYRTLGEVIELEHRRKEVEAQKVALRPDATAV